VLSDFVTYESYYRCHDHAPDATPEEGGFRYFAWLGRNRRMSKDYERLCATGEAFIYAAMIRLMLKRLTQAPAQMS
jgi:transposase